MKANELRVGNLYNQFGNIQEASWVTIKDLEKAPESQLWCKPFPLIEEWLLKFGFESCEGWDDMIFWILPDEIDNSDRFELLETDKGYELPSGSICPSVHLLQNCYYFHYLTGEELTIK